MKKVLSLTKSGDSQSGLQVYLAANFNLESLVQSLGFKELLVVSLRRDLACGVTVVLTIP